MPVLKKFMAHSLEQVGGAGQEEGDTDGVWERVKSQREVSRFGKNTRKVQPGWS